MKRRITAIVLAIACTLAGLLDVPAEEPAGRLMKPCVVISGADSHVTEHQYRRIISADEWIRVWQEHKGEKPTGQYDLFYNPLALPLIDFDRYMVIAIFQGNGWNSAGLRAISISVEDKRIVFRFEDKSYQTGGPHGGGRRVAVYGFFVVPRSTKSVVLEDNVQQYKGKPPVWQERITFPKR
jgi:hypothetical protein